MEKKCVFNSESDLLRIRIKKLRRQGSALLPSEEEKCQSFMGKNRDLCSDRVDIT